MSKTVEDRLEEFAIWNGWCGETSPFDNNLVEYVDSVVKILNYDKSQEEGGCPYSIRVLFTNNPNPYFNVTRKNLRHLPYPSQLIKDTAYTIRKIGEVYRSLVGKEYDHVEKEIDEKIIKGKIVNGKVKIEISKK